MFFNLKTQNIDIWHFRLGHPINKILDCVCQENSNIHYNDKNIYDFFFFVKQHILSFSDSKYVTFDAFHPIHIDIWGPFGIASIHWHRYFLKIVDDFSRHTWIFLIKNKSETGSLLNNFVMHVKNQFNKCLTDNGLEFDYKIIYHDFGNTPSNFCLEIPQQNYVVEMKHNTF